MNLLVIVNQKNLFLLTHLCIISFCAKDFDMFSQNKEPSWNVGYTEM